MVNNRKNQTLFHISKYNKVVQYELPFNIEFYQTHQETL